MIRGVFFDLGGTLRICDPAPEHQAAKQIKSRLLKLFLFADLTGEELSYAFAKKVFTEKLGIPFGGGEEIQEGGDEA